MAFPFLAPRGTLVLRLNTELNGYFAKMHQSPWNSEITLSNNFILHKSFLDIKDFRTPDKFNLIYFDAFAPAIQPELWEEDVFRKLSDALLPKGLLVTYCAKGEFRRSLQQIGFEVERLPGPPGKREMIRAILKSD